MRIIHVVNSLGGSGGAENGMVREITRFDQSIEQLVIRLYARDDLQPVLDAHGVEVAALGLDAALASWNWPLAAARVRGWIQRFDPAVVHTSLFTANIVGQLAGRSLQLPVLSTLTQSGDVDLIRSYQPGASTLRASAFRGIATRAARSRLVRFRALTSDAAATNLQVLGVTADRVRVIPRGVETDLPPPDPCIRERLGLLPDTPLLVNIGRQAAQKGHAFLIDAFERIAAAVPRANLVILGREGDATKQILDRLASSPVADRVHFLGFRQDASAILGAADVFVFSSLMEGLGTAVLEAMAAKVPVVAFDIPPIREITNEGRVAYLVAVGNAERLAEATTAVLDGSAPDLTDLAHNWVRERYDIQGVAAELQSYLEVVASSA